MAKLLITTEGFNRQIVSLKMGVNRFGRVTGNDFQIDHPTISSHHCDVELTQEGLSVRDNRSTNGTFIDGKPVNEGKLTPGQTLRLGDVEFLVETTEVTISIPKFEVEQPAPPVVLTDGAMICPRHSGVQVTHQCTHCQEVMCDACVRRMKRRGGKLLKLCPLCSHPVTPLNEEQKKKGLLFNLLHRTMKLPFLSGSKRRQAGND